MMGCGPSHLSKASKMSKTERAMKAALLIQRWYRLYLARLETKRRYSWKVFQSLEYSGEQDQMKLYNFFNELLTLTRENGNAGNILSGITKSSSFEESALEDGEEDLLEQTDPEKVVIASQYSGPHISLPITESQLEDLINAFKHKRKLHAKYVLQILHSTRQVLKSMPNISRTSTGFSKQLTVLGDLHGKLDDLLIVFHKNGLPSNYNPYVFNGDFVDRGPHSVEVALLLFASLIVHPNSVFINRGNHEDHVMNLRYGFVKEIMVKYRHHAPKIMQLFEDVFRWLPLATIIDNEILITHGGISVKTDLEYLEKIKREKYVSILRPPTSHDTGDDQVDLVEWRQVLDLLWSDPNANFGCTANTFRGGGSYFGPDVTEWILSKHRLKLLVRSHECKPEGYEYEHDGKVLTIFSASNYYEMGSNKGAYLKFTPDSLTKPKIVQYMATKHTKRKLTVKQRIGLVEESALQGLRQKICASKSLLVVAFTKYDASEKGLITIKDWCSAMSDTLEMDLPWRSLRSQLVKTVVLSDQEYVDYMSTFDAYTIENKYDKSASVTETLYRNRENLETIFRALDKDKSGFISLEEFMDACAVISQHSNTSLDKRDIDIMARNMDMNKDGQIDFNEFLEAFRIVDKFGNTSNGTGADDTISYSSSEPDD